MENWGIDHGKPANVDKESTNKRGRAWLCWAIISLCASVPCCVYQLLLLFGFSENHAAANDDLRQLISRSVLLVLPLLAGTACVVAMLFRSRRLSTRRMDGTMLAVFFLPLWLVVVPSEIVFIERAHEIAQLQAEFPDSQGNTSTFDVADSWSQGRN